MVGLWWTYGDFSQHSNKCCSNDRMTMRSRPACQSRRFTDAPSKRLERSVRALESLERRRRHHHKRQSKQEVMGMNHGQTQVNKAFVYSILVILEQCPLGPGEGH